MKNKSVKLNFIMNFILSSSSILFPLITYPYVSKILLPEGTGTVAFATSTISYFTMIAMLGIPTYGIRACAKVRDNKEELTRVVHELLLINMVMTVISYILLTISLYLVPEFYNQKGIILVCSLAIILNTTGINWLYQAVEEYTYIAIVSIFFKIISLILMFLYIHQKSDYLIYGLMTVLSSYGSGIFNLVRMRKIIYLKPVGNYNFKRHLKPILTFFAMTVATTAYTNMDTVMLGFMKDNHEVGLYNTSIKVKSLVVTLITSLGTVLLPRLSYYLENERKEEFNNLISKAFSFVLLFSIPCCLYFVIYSKEIILFLSGGEMAYLGAISPMCILMPTILLIGLSNITGIQILVPSGNEKIVLKSVTIGAIVDFIINLLLIPFYGASGAAIGTLAAEFVVLIIQIYFLRDLIKIVNSQVEFKQLCISVLVFTIVLFLSKLVVINNIFATLIITASFCFFVYGLALLITREEIVLGIFNTIINSIKKH